MDREEDLGESDGTSSLAPTCSSGVPSHLSTMITVPTGTAVATMSDGETVQTTSGDGNTLAASDRTDNILEEKIRLDLNEFLKDCIFH